MFREPTFAQESKRSFGSYFEQKLVKQKEQDAARVPEQSAIFRGCRCYVQGIHSGRFTVHEICRLVKAHGGLWDVVLRKSTTHWICEAIPDGKVGLGLGLGLG